MCKSSQNYVWLSWHRCQQIDAAKSNQIAMGMTPLKAHQKMLRGTLLSEPALTSRLQSQARQTELQPATARAQPRQRERKPSSTLTRRTCVLLHWPKKLAYPQEDS